MKVEGWRWQRKKKDNDVELIKTVGTTDSKSGGSGIAVCGVAAAKVAGSRVGANNNYWLAEELNFLQIIEEISPITNKEWNSVVKQHNESNPDIDWVGERNKNLICHQYCTLYQ